MAKLQHLIRASQLSPTRLQELFASADRLKADDRARRIFPVLQGRILATLFYEPSTRTRLSFEAAMQKLGGSVLSVENARNSSSAVKGETIADTVRVIAGYADAIAIRHYEEGTAAAAAANSPVPVINAGDGIGEHPTQALADTYTIHAELGRLDHLHVALVGDLLRCWRSTPASVSRWFRRPRSRCLRAISRRSPQRVHTSSRPRRCGKRSRVPTLCM